MDTLPRNFWSKAADERTSYGSGEPTYAGKGSKDTELEPEFAAYSTTGVTPVVVIYCRFQTVHVLLA